MRKTRYNIFFLLIFLIGLNFWGSAILLSYVLLFYTLLFIRESRKIPYNFFLVLLFVISMLGAIVYLEENSLIYQFMKIGIYVCIYLSFYFLALECVNNLNNMEDIINIFAKCFYYFSFGNMMHLILNITSTDIGSINLGYRVLNDYWSGGTVPTTIVLGWGCFLMPLLIFYVEKYRQEKYKAIFSIILMLFYIVFSFKIATRFGVVNALLVVMMYLLLKIHQKEIVISRSALIKLGIVGVIFIILSIKIVPLILNSNLVLRMTKESISLFSSNGRLEASVYLLKHWTESLVGGGYFTKQYGLQQHNILLQIYDIYGIIPFLSLFLILIVVIHKVLAIYNNTVLSNSNKRFCVLIFFSLFIYLFEEPAFSSNFVITAILFGELGFMSILMKLSNKKG